VGSWEGEGGEGEAGKMTEEFAERLMTQANTSQVIHHIAEKNTVYIFLSDKKKSLSL
jgi:hypothetical protein